MGYLFRSRRGWNAEREERRESRLHFSPVQAGDLYLPYDGEKEEEDAAAATTTTSVMMPLQCVHKLSPRFRESRRTEPASLHADAESLCQSSQRVSKIKPRVTLNQNHTYNVLRREEDAQQIN